jgi:hypothetical protein
MYRFFVIPVIPVDIPYDVVALMLDNDRVSPRK